MTFWQSARQAQQTFSDPLEKAAQTENLLAQAKLAPARENYFNALAKATNVRAELEPERINLLGSRDAYLQDRLKVLQQNANLKAANLALQNQKAGFAPPPGSLLGKHGRASGTKERNQANIAMASIRQLNDIIDSLGSTGQSLLKNAPTKYKKYVSAFNSSLDGKATPEQQKFLNDLGISQDDIVRAGELSISINQLPKVKASMMHMFNLFKPRLGDNPQSYAKRLQQTKDLANLAYRQDQFIIGNGMPIDSKGDDIMDKWVQQQMGERYPGAQLKQVKKIADKLKSSSGDSNFSSNDTDIEAYKKYLKEQANAAT